LDLGIEALLAIVRLFTLHLARHWILRLNDQNDAASQDRLTDRYTRSIEQMGDRSETIRIGGMFALQALMSEKTASYHWTQVEVLCAFIRKESRQKTKEDHKNIDHLNPVKLPSRLPQNIEVAVSVLRERNSNSQIEDDRTLQRCGANLAGANLENAILDGAILAHANLERALSEET